MRSVFYSIVGVLLLGGLAGFVRAEYPPGHLPEPHMIPEAGAELPPRTAPKTVPANLTHPPIPDPVWDGVVAGHEDYARRVDALPEPEPEAGWHLFASAGVYYLEPHLESNPGFLVFRRQPGAPPASGVVGLGSEEAFAPQLSFGLLTDCGWGLRTHWWHIDRGSRLLTDFNRDPTLGTFVQTPPLVGVPGFTSPGAVARAFRVFNDYMTFGSHLNLHAWDWEVTRAWHLGGWDLEVAGGVRYAYLSQNYQATRSNSGSGVSGTSRVTVIQDTDLVQTGHNFSGAGPTLAFEVRRPLGDSGFALYATGRGSVLFGRARTHSFQRTVANYRITPVRGAVQTVNTTTARDATRDHNDDLPVDDLELGVEWSRVVGPVRLVGPLRLFLRTGLVGQGWFDAGNGTSDRGDLSFFGLSLTAGVTY
jgi:hypothetical protein